MKLSVAVICHNSLANLSRLLESVQSGLEGVSHEVVITDNGSTDGTDIFLAAHYPEVNYLRLNENRGVAFARNRTIERCRGELIWILDDDTVINARAARDMLHYMDSHPECGIAACALFSAEGERQLSYKPYPGFMLKLRNVVGIKAVDPYDGLVAGGEPFEPVYVIGACQLVRRRVFESVGLLDESIFYGPEDADFCLRARVAGWRIAYLPAPAIIHHWRRSTTRRPLSRLGRAHIRGLLHFYFKWSFRDRRPGRLQEPAGPPQDPLC